MEMNLYLLLALLIALLVIGYLLAKLHRVRGQLSLIKDALTDIKNGNLTRRVLARESDLTKQICYDINEIAMSSQSRLIQQKQAEQAYKRLMTSLSHSEFLLNVFQMLNTAHPNIRFYRSHNHSFDKMRWRSYFPEMPI